MSRKTVNYTISDLNVSCSFRDPHSGFPPVVSSGRVMILGSFPGLASLQARGYYAHPRNLFWRIMEELFGAGPESSYEKRQEILKQRGISLWDVLLSGERQGSLDNAIRGGTLNNFSMFFAQNPAIDYLFFNGKTAHTLFIRYVLPNIRDKKLHLHVLPSTSPANAGISFSRKLEAWRVVSETVSAFVKEKTQC